MNPARKKRLEAKGWKVGTVSEFLGITEEDYNAAVAEADALIDAGPPEEGSAEDDRLTSLCDFIKGYEDEHDGPL